LCRVNCPRDDEAAGKTFKLLRAAKAMAITTGDDNRPRRNRHGVQGAFG
jgi:hypothetical protein